MSHRPNIPAALTAPAKPTEITLETLPQLFAHHRSVFGGWSMEDPPEPPAAPARPEGVTEQEWSTLGDAGRVAIVREREARQTAERALAAARARPAPPKNDPTPAAPVAPAAAAKPETPAAPAAGAPDIAAIINDAVQAAIKPFQDAEQDRVANDAARSIQEALIKAAEPLLYDASDALAGVDLTQLTDGTGQADAAKITTALEDLVKRKPHLAKPEDERRYAPPGGGAGPTPGGSTVPLDTRVKDTLARMQASVGLPPSTTSTT